MRLPVKTLSLLLSNAAAATNFYLFKRISCIYLTFYFLIEAGYNKSKFASEQTFHRLRRLYLSGIKGHSFHQISFEADILKAL